MALANFSRAARIRLDLRSDQSIGGCGPPSGALTSTGWPAGHRVVEETLHPKGQPMNIQLTSPALLAALETSPANGLLGAAELSLDNPPCQPDAKAAPVSRVPWPGLDQLGLSAAERQQRREGLGGSDANAILSGDRERVLQLWREKRGEAEGADLSSTLPVMLGSWTEPFNRMWFEKLTGQPVMQMGQAISCSTYSWRRCTLDGYICETQAIWEAKHTSAFARPEEVLERYMPQLQHNMSVAKSERAVLSVIFGNSRFEIFEVAADWLYQLDLLQAEEEFWECVLSGREPVPSPVPSPPKPIGSREVCLEGNNAWASAAVEWLENREAAKRHATASTSIKGLVEEDVSRAFGHGVEAKRSRAGAISIREMVR